LASARAHPVLRDALDKTERAAHTGFRANFSPSACAALGDTIIPRDRPAAPTARERRRQVRRTVMVDDINGRNSASSPRRFDPAIVLCRSMLYLTARRQLLRVVERDTGRSSISAPYCRPTIRTPWRVGTMLSFSSMSNSLSHSDANTTADEARASVGSSTSVLGQTDAKRLRARRACRRDSDDENEPNQAEAAVEAHEEISVGERRDGEQPRAGTNSHSTCHLDSPWRAPLKAFDFGLDRGTVAGPCGPFADGRHRTNG